MEGKIGRFRVGLFRAYFGIAMIRRRGMRNETG